MTTMFATFVRSARVVDSDSGNLAVASRVRGAAARNEHAAEATAKPTSRILAERVSIARVYRRRIGAERTTHSSVGRTRRPRTR
jgi:hypothetical protein